MRRVLQSRLFAVAASTVLVAGISSSGAGALSLPAQSGAGPATFLTQAYRPLRVTVPRQVTLDDPVPTRTYSEPFMLVDPDNPKVIVASAVEIRTNVCYLMRSTDSGSTWHILPSLPGTKDFPGCFTVNGGQTQTPMAWGRNHTLYYALLGYDQADGGSGRQGNISVLLARSSDLGNSWSTTVVDNSRGKTGDATQNDSPVATVAVDSRHGSQDVVYVAWQQSFPRSMNHDSPSLVATSADGGRTFQKPVNMNGFYHDTYTDTDPMHTKYNIALGVPYLAVGPSGKLYVLAQAAVPFSVNTFPPLPLLSGVSTDHGKTWTIHKFGGPPSSDLSQAVMTLSTHGGTDGTLLAVFEDKFGGQPQGNEDIYFQRSTDGGSTWSAPARLNDDNPANQNEHIFPTISVAPNGRIDAAWYDYRDANTDANDVYYTYSTDDGVSWAHNIRVTDQSIDRTVGLNTNFDIKLPPGVGSSNDLAVIGWTDTRLANPATQTVDVFAGVVQFHAITTSSSHTLRYLAAGAAGLVAAGVVVLLVAFGRRRKVEPPAPPRTRQREPVGVS